MPKGIYQFEKRKGLFAKEHKTKVGKKCSEEVKIKIGLANGIRQHKETEGFQKENKFGKRFEKGHKLSIKENNPNWQGGKSFEPYGLEFDNDLKEVIRNRDRRKCFICEKTELESGEKLHCHHIDYNKRNNNPNNLISLCRKCHMKTNNKREYWTKYFYEAKL